MAALCEAALKADADTARAINDKLMPLHKALFPPRPATCEQHAAWVAAGRPAGQLSGF